MLRGYNHGLDWVLRHQRLMLASTLALIVATGALYVLVPKGFIPQQDTGFIFGEADTRQDTRSPPRARVENELSAIILQDKAVAAVVGFAGATSTTRRRTPRGCSSSSSRSTSATGWRR